MSETNQQAGQEVKHIIEAIDFGFEVQAFLESKIGKYIIDRAESEIAEALELLKTVDPTDAKAITALQTSIYRAEQIQYWLAEAMQSGFNAQREFNEQGA